MLEVGQIVRFVGRASEMGKYHPDYAQLINQVGSIVEAYDVGPFEYVVIFNQFPDSEGLCDYPCRADELEAV